MEYTFSCKNKMKNKKIYFISIIIFSLLVVSTLLIIKYKENSLLLNNEFSTDLYTINLPNNITIESNNKIINLFISGKKVGYVATYENCQFCNSISSIVSNYLGMHANIHGNIKETNYDSYKKSKVYIDYELSASQQIKGELPVTKELHYFYTTNNNLFIDLQLNTEYISEKNAENISNSLNIK